MRKRILEEIERERGEVEREINELKDREERLGGELKRACIWSGL